MADTPEIKPPIRAFLHVALLKRMSLLPLYDRRGRRQLAEDFLRIRDEHEAREYIHATRIMVRTAKRSSRKEDRDETTPKEPQQ